MFGFLLKIVIIAGLVGGVGWYVMGKKSIPLPKNLSGVQAENVLSKLPLDKDAINNIRGMKPDKVISQVSGLLDSLVTHQSPNGGPIVLGVKVSNDSIGTVVDVLESLPQEQFTQIRNALCASSSGN